MGVGRMWSPKTGWGNAKDVLEQNGLDIIEYKPKEVRQIKSSPVHLHF
jgi:histidine ammonia-lyase